MDELMEFIDHDDQIVKDAALNVKMLKDMHEKGEITAEQFKELAEDILEANKVRRLSIRLERKIIILQAFTTIRNLIGAIIP